MNAGRKPTPAPESRELAINTATVRGDFDSLAELGAQEQERVTALAHQIGYEGSLTVGTLEDEIRFYQRRTVEAILETGKRLLLLKELTPHGEFTKRAELLGFSGPTARRFMQAAEKTAKSLKLSVLSTQVSPSWVSNNLPAIEAETGFVERVAGTNRWRLGVPFVRIAMTVTANLHTERARLEDTAKRYSVPH